MKPDVSIVVPCLNERNYIERCIRSVERQDYPAGRIELIVADGGSTDGTLEILTTLLGEISGFKLIDNPSRFTPRALNLGIEASTGDVIIILGAHAELEPDFVAEAMRLLDAQRDAGCAGGIITNVHENRTAAIISLAMASPFGVGNARFRTGGKAGFVDTVAFGAYRREVFDRVGMFDEELIRNQDDELNYRLLKAGFKIWFDPSIRSKYYVRGDFKRLFRQYYQYGYWKVFVNRKHRTVTTLRQLVPFLFVSWLGLALVLTVINTAFIPLLTLPLFLWFLSAFGAGLYAGTPSKDLPALVRTFLTLHLAYGSGYARGIVDFLVLGRKPSAREQTLTR